MEVSYVYIALYWFDYIFSFHQRSFGVCELVLEGWMSVRK